MANSGLISRMLEIITGYEVGQFTSLEVETAIEFHMQGLEQINLAAIHTARRLTHRLVNAHMSMGEEEFVDAEEIATVVRDLRQFLRTLPDD